MAILTDLPVEILQQILHLNQSDDDDDDAAILDEEDLLRVALVAPRLVPIAQKQLFKNMYIFSYQYPGRAKFERFMTLLQSSPIIASYVERVHLKWITDRWEVSTILDDLLCLLPALRDLRFETDSPAHSKVLDFAFFDTNPMLNLKIVHLDGARMSFKSALMLARKPGMVELKLGRCEGYEADRECDTREQANLALRTLDTTGSVLLDIELEQLLACGPMVSTLICNLPRQLQDDDERPILWQYRVGVPASRQRLAHCLRPIAPSLIDLTVQTVSEDLREEAAPDLTLLVSLKSLNIQAACLWPGYVNVFYDERKHLSSRLPKSLEELEITFEKGKNAEGIFWSADRIDMLPRHHLLMQATDFSRIEWIDNLARSKMDRLPHLRSIRLNESFSFEAVDGWHDVQGDQGPSMELISWHPPCELERFCRQEKIELDIWLRMRKPSLLMIEAPP